MGLKRGDHARVQTEVVEFIVLPFLFSSKLKIWSFHVRSFAGTVRKCTKKRDARAELLFCSLNLLFSRSPRRRHRSFVRYLAILLETQAHDNLSETGSSANEESPLSLLTPL